MHYVAGGIAHTFLRCVLPGAPPEWSLGSLATWPGGESATPVEVLAHALIAAASGASADGSGNGDDAANDPHRQLSVYICVYLHAFFFFFSFFLFLCN